MPGLLPPPSMLATFQIRGDIRKAVFPQRPARAFGWLAACAFAYFLLFGIVVTTQMSAQEKGKGPVSFKVESNKDGIVTLQLTPLKVVNTSGFKESWSYAPYGGKEKDKRPLNALPTDETSPQIRKFKLSPGKHIVLFLEYDYLTGANGGELADGKFAENILVDNSSAKEAQEAAAAKAALAKKDKEAQEAAAAKAALAKKNKEAQEAAAAKAEREKKAKEAQEAAAAKAALAKKDKEAQEAAAKAAREKKDKEAQEAAAAKAAREKKAEDDVQNVKGVQKGKAKDYTMLIAWISLGLMVVLAVIFFVLWRKKGKELHEVEMDSNLREKNHKNRYQSLHEASTKQEEDINYLKNKIQEKEGENKTILNEIWKTGKYSPKREEHFKLLKEKEDEIESLNISLKDKKDELTGLQENMDEKDQELSAARERLAAVDGKPVIPNQALPTCFLSSGELGDWGKRIFKEAEENPDHIVFRELLSLILLLKVAADSGDVDNLLGYLRDLSRPLYLLLKDDSDENKNRGIVKLWADSLNDDIGKQFKVVIRVPHHGEPIDRNWMNIMSGQGQSVAGILSWAIIKDDVAVRKADIIT